MPELPDPLPPAPRDRSTWTVRTIRSAKHPGCAFLALLPPKGTIGETCWVAKVYAEADDELEAVIRDAIRTHYRAKRRARAKVQDVKRAADRVGKRLVDEVVQRRPIETPPYVEHRRALERWDMDLDFRGFDTSKPEDRS